MIKSTSLWGEMINFWFLGPIKSPPRSSSLAPHPDQPEFTPVQDELEAMELWGSGIWLPHEKLEDQLQELLRALVQEECHNVVCILPSRGLFHQPKSLPWILLLLTKRITFFSKPSIYDAIGLIFLGCFNDMPDHWFFQRGVLGENLAKKLNYGNFSVLDDLES